MIYSQYTLKNLINQFKKNEPLQPEDIKTLTEFCLEMHKQLQKVAEENNDLKQKFEKEVRDIKQKFEKDLKSIKDENVFLKNKISRLENKK